MTDLKKISYLVALQELFNRKQEIQDLYREPDQKLNKVSKEYQALSVTYKDISLNVSEMDKKIEKETTKLEEINNRITSLEEGKDKIKIARQLKSWEKEMEKMQQDQSLLLAQIEYDSSTVEEMRGESERINRKLEEQKAKIDGYEEEIETVKMDHAKEIKEIDTESLKLKENFDPQFSDYFDTMLTKTKGSAIVTVDEESCAGCNIILPTTLQGDLGPNLSVDQMALHQCPHCFRYLYFEKWLEQLN